MRNLQDDVDHRADDPQHHQPPPDVLVHPPLPRRHRNQQRHERHQQRHSADEQRAIDVDPVRPQLDLAVRVLVLPVLRARHRHVQPTQADAQQDVQHRPAKAGRQGHDRVAEARDRDVGDEIAERVAHREHRQPEDGVGHVEHDADRLDHADDLVRNRADPRNAHEKADEAEHEAPARRPAQPRRRHHQAQNAHRRQQGDEHEPHQPDRCRFLANVHRHDRCDEERRAEDLHCNEPAAPVLRLGRLRVTLVFWLRRWRVHARRCPWR